ncbi:hypothetical protein, conserved [Babesia bigemina]|uniref:Uncharacterized protein n=1 Tax=Babesia bigemina TaxID=5866 RepID=A0A061D889_BABBI|nr:hypothetical protein, conserved [Babesia bigemina]CDR95134.1 hypothetical protein, conserved [Babesia bigemina]|eukprot:XP_012767320.1 hypothetical protein, conserved [Babesia bigemina]
MAPYGASSTDASRQNLSYKRYRSRSRSRTRDSPDAAPSRPRREDSAKAPLATRTGGKHPGSSQSPVATKPDGASNAECNPNAGDDGSRGNRSTLPYIYQQREFIRICTDLIRKCECESELKSFLSSLDNGASVDLGRYGDAHVRKKFRHLARALYLHRSESTVRKPPECNISLLEALTEKLPYIRQKAQAQGPYVRHSRPAESSEPSENNASDMSQSNTTDPSDRELLSLREMHEQGFFVEYEALQKEFADRHASHDVWGKTPQEQLAIMREKESASKSSDAENSQPWKVFDREKEIVSGSKIDDKGYAHLLQSGKNLGEIFGPGQTHSSFV